MDDDEQDGIVIRRSVVLITILVVSLIVAGIIAFAMSGETDKERFERRQTCEFGAAIGGRSADTCD